MAEKKSFLIYFDQRDALAYISDELRGRLILAVLDYAQSGEYPDSSDKELMGQFVHFKSVIDRDNAKYLETCERNRKSARKRWDASACERMQSDAKHADRDRDRDRDIYSDIPDGQSAQLWKKRPKACEPKQWQKYLDYSREFLEGRQEVFGKIIKVTDVNIANGAVALDNLIRVKGYDKDGVHKVIQWGINDSFWSDQVRSIASLTKKAKNGEIKFNNVYVAMKKDIANGM